MAGKTLLAILLMLSVEDQGSGAAAQNAMSVNPALASTLKTREGLA